MNHSLIIVYLSGYFMFVIQIIKSIDYMKENCKIVYNDYESFFEQLLVKDRSFCIHNQNSYWLMTEVFQVLNNMTNNVDNNFVKSSHGVSLQYQGDLIISSVNSALNGKNSFRYFG